MNRTPLLLTLLLPLALIACSSANESSKGQLITCQTDPGTDVILSCEPGGGDSGDPNSCVDVDEDGDGECGDDDDDDGAGSGSGSGSGTLGFAPSDFHPVAR